MQPKIKPDRGPPTVYYAKLARGRETWELYAGAAPTAHGAVQLVLLGARRGSEAELHAWAKARGIRLIDLDGLRRVAKTKRENETTARESAAAKELGL